MTSGGIDTSSKVAGTTTTERRRVSDRTPEPSAPDTFQETVPTGIPDRRSMQAAAGMIPATGDRRVTSDRRQTPPTEGATATATLQPQAVGTFSEPASLSADMTNKRQSPQDLSDEQAFFQATLSQIQSAQPGDIIGIQMYEFQNALTNPTAPEAKNAPGYANQEALLGALADASKRGVQVKMVLDASKNTDKKSPEDGQLNNQPIADYFAKNGDPKNLSLIWYPPNTVNIDHAKQLVHMRPEGQDGKYQVVAAIGGGSNYGTHTPDNNDGGIITYGQDALPAAQVFLNDQALSVGRTSQTKAPTLPADAPVRWLTTSPTSHDILDAKMAMLNDCDEYYSNQFVLTEKPLVDRICQMGKNAHIVLDPSEKQFDMTTYQRLKAAGVDVKWANVTPGQLLHRKEDIYLKNGQITGATIGSANDTANGLEQPKTAAEAGETPHRVTNHEVDAVVTNFTDGNYSTLPFLQALLARQKANLAAGLDTPPGSGGGGGVGQF